MDMKSFIDPATKLIYAYAADGSDDAFIRAGLEPISDADLAALRAVQNPLTQADYENAVQSLQDDTAKKYGYDSIRSAISYADDPTVAEFQAEGLAFRVWRSSSWQYAYTQLAAANAGTTPLPTIADFISGLPALNLGPPTHAQ